MIHQAIGMLDHTLNSAAVERPQFFLFNHPGDKFNILGQVAFTFFYFIIEVGADLEYFLNSSS